MLPRWHIFFGFIFCLIFKILSPETTYVSIFLIWFASVFIDFDHYLSTGINVNKWGIRDNLTHSYESRKQIISQKNQEGLCKRGELHIFHTVEAHLFIGLIGIFFVPFFFLLIGMVLHSTLDIIWMVRHDILDSREFFLINKLRTFLL